MEPMSTLSLSKFSITLLKTFNACSMSFTRSRAAPLPLKQFKIILASRLEGIEFSWMIVLHKSVRMSRPISPATLRISAAIPTAMLYVICYMLYVICCYMLYVVTCYMLLHVICYMLYVICYMLYAICYMLYAICYMLYAICYMLYAICYMLYAICYKLYHVICYML